MGQNLEQRLQSNLLLQFLERMKEDKVTCFLPPINTSISGWVFILLLKEKISWKEGEWQED